MENKETTTMNVIVHKANISLQDGESLSDFSNALSQAAKQYALQQLNVADGKGWAYLVEAYPKKVVVEVSQEGQSPRYTYQQMGYTRDKNGKFEFDNMVQVKRVTTFKPSDPKVSIAKAADLWEPVEKSLFSDIV